ncbi:MAG: transglycosylase domain-containing protein, partial [Clostridia bacterium]|nr:transglycosylase domain-containing protein [Clostridia bacterium]
MKKGRKIKRILRRILWIILATMLWIALLIGVCVAFYLVGNFSTSAEELLPTLGTHPRSPQFYLYQFDDRTNRTGERVEVTGDVWAGRQTEYVLYEEIPQAMIDAVVAIEDKRFFEHRGTDWRRTLAAVGNYILRGDSHFGGST